MIEGTFYDELRNELPDSDGSKRERWAQFIVDNDVDLVRLSKLLDEDKTIAMRFAWLLTDVALKSSQASFEVLPFLLKKSKGIEHFAFSESFANYWLIASVPEENEAEAINLLFNWISSNEVNVTIKSRAIKVLTSLTEKYPDLKNELIVCLKEQMNLHSENFKVTVSKTLSAFNQD